MNDMPCFATRAAFANADFAGDLGEVMIERFDAASARSAAVYVCCGKNEPDHPLKARNGDSWWTIHPDYMSLEAAGASDDETSDCLRAMENVLAYLAATSRARLRLGARDYVLASGVRQVQRIDGPALSFAIEGHGAAVSRLVVPQSGMPADGAAIELAFASDRSEFLASDFSLIATGNGEADSRRETAILARFANTGKARPGHRSAVLSNVAVHGEGDGFKTAIDLAGASDPLIRDCIFDEGAPSGADRESLNSGSVGAPASPLNH